ncbi:hypothetical protein [Phytoactinopolyspora limicola]|uniref:hypothetical protein n=1 Tax=Phytoactinopolyspora limicola TaxID=2715536 RepID=UPI00140A9E62|nr:hypothetical protein [Phytoactinopolyspora limicola]
MTVFPLSGDLDDIVAGQEISLTMTREIGDRDHWVLPTSALWTDRSGNVVTRVVRDDNVVETRVDVVGALHGESLVESGEIRDGDLVRLLPVPDAPPSTSP